MNLKMYTVIECLGRFDYRWIARHAETFDPLAVAFFEDEEEARAFVAEMNNSITSAMHKDRPVDQASSHMD